ncbi:hypothetical protein Ppa06_39980 [Planomonospora parontospora subsp. parontospora]|uniref:Uncharacterized protein n=2 Tax=Planomonospora parontospora TaxID=58119 RepID=A0AA37BI97_9ACTN|nr:hypothetical protein GCM10010126_38940 [Planomonospora parontospora]GII10200.1 hypothetical protein Ppa06_39980 [Planomonospora parontospora subsp. parontospora]
MYYSSSAGKNCALTYGYGAYADTASWKRVTISRGDGSGEDTDTGQYKYYAGPVYVSASGQCIDVAGTVPGRAHPPPGRHPAGRRPRRRPRRTAPEPAARLRLRRRPSWCRPIDHRAGRSLRGQRLAGAGGSGVHAPAQQRVHAGGELTGLNGLVM